MSSKLVYRHQIIPQSSLGTALAKAIRTLSLVVYSSGRNVYSSPCCNANSLNPMETAHSMPPESAGSRSPGWRCRGVDVASTGSAQPFIACGVLILPNCRHTLCCTAERWRRECAGEAGRSRRPRQWRVSGAGSTRFHQTEMVRPAVGAATTERWSVRGPGVRLHRLPLKLQKPHQTG